MNPCFKLYCRVYQTLFHLALPILPYREPKIYSDVCDSAEILKEKGISRALLITDGFLRSSGATAKLEESLREGGISLAVYDKTRPNPTFQNVEEALLLYKESGAGALIAQGGGSSIDCAKAVGARLAHPKKSLGKLRGNLRVFHKLPCLIAIPTTAGTGSEVTLTAVVTDEQTKTKYTMNAFPLIPSHAILDPKVTETLPPSLTATTGIDALTHAVEVYIGRSCSKETRSLAEEATRLIFENLPLAYADGKNTTARRNMLRAAYAAGIAFSKSYVGYVHAVAHTLGGQYNIPHGLANSVLLPVVLRAYGETIDPQLCRLAVSAGLAPAAVSDKEGAQLFLDALDRLCHTIGIPEKLEGIREEDIPKMAKRAAKEANPLYPVPILMDAEQLEDFYRQVAAPLPQNTERRTVDDRV